MGCHFFFQELDFCFVGCFGGLVAAEINQLLPEVIQAREKVCAHDSKAAVGVGNIAVTLDHRVPLGRIISIRRAGDGDGFLAMDAGVGFAVHLHIGGGADGFLAQGAAFGAESVSHLIHPILHFTAAQGSDRACIGFEMDIPVALDVSFLLHVQSRGVLHRCHGILLDRNRDGGGVQDIAVRSDADSSLLAVAVATGHGGDVALRRFRRRIEIGRRTSFVVHIVFRARIAPQAVHIHQCFTFHGGIVSAAHRNGAAFVGAIIDL